MRPVHLTYMALKVTEQDVSDMHRVMTAFEAIQHEAQMALDEEDPERVRQALQRIESMADTDGRMGVVQIVIRWVRRLKGD